MIVNGLEDEITHAVKPERCIFATNRFFRGSEMQFCHISRYSSFSPYTHMQNLREYRIVAHVHDEVVLEVPMNTTMEKACEIMGQSPPWLPGIELRVDGFQTQFYQK